MTKFTASTQVRSLGFVRPSIGHNSVQIPHNGVLQDNPKRIVNGAKFKASSFFRPTQMSVEMAKAGVLPGTHMVRQLACTALLRHKNDNRNCRPSAHVAF